MPEAIDRRRENASPVRLLHAGVTPWTERLARVTALWAALALAALAPSSATAQLNLYSTIEVDTTSASTHWTDGKCSLREAIINANNHNQGSWYPGECEEANGSIGSNIVFDPAVFGGGAAIVFDVSSGPLPAISADFTTIDGWSAGGSGYTGPPLVTLDGSGLVSSATPVTGLSLASSSSTVRGLAVVSFTTPSGGDSVGISVSGVSDRVYGNHVGIEADGASAAGNTRGIVVQRDAVGALIGTNGDGVGDEAERNVVSGNDGAGIVVLTPDTTLIAGNYVGTDAGGVAAIANGTGIEAAGNVVVGGDAASERNVIAGNVGSGIEYQFLKFDSFSVSLSAPDVRGNYIGTDRTGLAALPNNQGITMGYSWLASLDGTPNGGIVRDNVVAGNTDVGILIGLDCTAGNPLCRGVIDNQLVIDNLVGLGADGVTVVGNGGGILVIDSPENLIRSNYVSGNTQYGIRLQGSGSHDNTVDLNVVGLDADYHAVLQQSVGVEIDEGTANTILGNTLSGSATQLAIVGVGIGLGPNLVSNNRIGTDPYDGYAGWFGSGVVVTDSTNTTLAHNLITSCTQAVELSGATEVTLFDNLLTGNSTGSGSALHLQDGATVLFGSTGNCVENNASGVVNSTGFTAMLESNWWGAPSGPSGTGPGSGDSVSADVDFDPWLTTRPDCGVRLLFLDDFESGDSHHWTSTTP